MSYNAANGKRRDWVSAYLWGGAWALTFAVLSPAPLVNAIGITAPLIIATAGVLGAGLAVRGSVTKNNLIVERAGVSILFFAPLFYGTIQVAAIVVDLYDTGITSRWHLPLLAVFTATLIAPRRRHLTELVKAARATPTESETEGPRP